MMIGEVSEMSYKTYSVVPLIYKNIVQHLDNQDNQDNLIIQKFHPILVNEIDYRNVGGVTRSSINFLTTTGEMEVWVDEKPSVVGCVDGYPDFNIVYDISWFDGWTLQRTVVAIKVDRICVGDNYVYNFVNNIIWRTYNT